MIKRFRD